MTKPDEIVTTPDELLNVVIISVMAMGLLLIIVGCRLAYDGWLKHNFIKYVKEQKERLQKETSEEATEAEEKGRSINTRRGKW